MDDISIYSEMMEEHMKLVRQVLRKLLHAKLYAKFSKSEFHKTSLDYLGYKVSCEGVEMSILEW